MIESLLTGAFIYIPKCYYMELKAIATKYNGIVFRSRLEAIFYRYFELDLQRIDPDENYCLTYEPEVWKTKTWNPDLSFCYKTEQLEQPKLVLCEVKPSAEKFNIFKYLPSFNEENNVCNYLDSILLACPESIIEICKSGSVHVIPIDEQLYKQASNDVYYEVNNGK